MKQRMSTLTAPQSGFSLIEVMVGMVISLLATIVIFQVFAISEGQKRTTTSSSDAQQNGLQSLFMVEREARMAGTGLVGMGCTVINAYDATRTPADFTISGLPVLITQNDPAAGFDSVTVLYSSSSTAAVPTTIKTPMPLPSQILNATYASQVKASNVLILSESGKPCARLQATQDGQKTGIDWNVQHNSGASSDYNPAGGQAEALLFPAGGYGAGAQLWTYGSMVNRRYYVQNNNLMMQDLAAGTTSTLVSGVVALRAQYGRDTTGDGVADIYDNTALTTNSEAVSVRIAVVARSAQYEKTTVSPASLKLWPDSASAPTTTGPTLALDTTAQHYRYKVYQTIVPLRNVIWNE